MVIQARDVSYRYTKGQDALSGVSFDVPEGAIFGLIGPNGAGKSTLLQCCAGLRYPRSGTIHVFGRDARTTSPMPTGHVGYIAEGVALPPTMTLAQLERYIAPLHVRWDHTLATTLRERFALDPARRIRTLSRGEHMKAALLCALAPRPRLLLMDEPFTGMDPMVKDELVRGLLGSAMDSGTTVLVASHDLPELEAVIDHVGIISCGRMVVSGSIDHLHAQFRRVTIVAPEPTLTAAGQDDAWIGVERAGRQLSFLADGSRTSVLPQALALRFPGADEITFADPTLRELLTMLAGRRGDSGTLERSA